MIPLMFEVHFSSVLVNITVFYDRSDSMYYFVFLSHRI